MSNQLVITSGAKVRSLEGVITGTSGVLNALGINVANGIPQLDGSGKILVSQLPNSVMEYKGTWNVATNTPYLVNGVGNAGDVYIVTGAASGGTNHDFGAGNILFYNGDQAIYDGSLWQRASGSTGSVTSVAASITGNSIGITGSPITTAGTLAFAFSGTNLQYINGAGNLTTFPTLISSIGLSMPSAFSVANSPLTANGTIAVTGAGTSSQYIDGTGALQSFPALTGYVPYTGATSDVDLGTHILNAQALHIKGTAGNGHLGLKHQSATPSASANESLIYANVDGDLGWLNGNLYLTTFNTHANTANRVYTFPDISGNVAVSSADNNFTGINSFDIGINYKTGASLAGVSGYISMGYDKSGSGASSTLSMKIADGNGSKAVNLDFVGSPATYTYTFPSTSGTVALTSNLSSYVPYSGATGNVNLGSYGLTASSLNINNVSTLDGNVLLKKAGLSVTTGTYLTQFAASSGVGIGYSDGTGGANFTFPTASIYTYTFPAATGTIALTSNLSSYLPLSGGTMTGDVIYNNCDILLNNGRAISGQLYGTSSYAVMLSMTPANKVQIDAYGQGVIFGGTIGSGTYTYTLPSATGTLALTSNIPTVSGASGQVAFFNGTSSITGSNNLYWDSTNSKLGVGTGVTTLNAILTLYTTSAANQIKAAGTAPAITFSDGISSSTYAGVYGVATAANHFVTGTAAGDMAIANQSATAGAIVFGTGTTERMRMTSAGTFSIGNTNTTYNLDVTGTGRFTSSVTAGQGLFTSSSFPLDLTANTNNYGIRLTSVQAPTLLLYSTYNTANNRNWGVFTNSQVFGDFDIRQSNAKDGDMTNGANSTSRLYIGNTGNVGIGTSSPSYKLSVVGDAYAGIGVNDGTNTAVLQWHSSDGFRLNVVTSKPMLFFTNDTERMRITSGGNVGIGTASPNIVGFTGTVLTVNGTGNYQGFEVATSGTSRMIMSSNGTDGYISTRQAGMNIIFEAGSASEKMRITSGGNVGIGTSSPGSILHTLKSGTAISGIGDEVFIGQRSNGVDNAAVTIISNNLSIIRFSNTSNVELGAIAYDNPNNIMQFKTNATERMRITSGGILYSYGTYTNTTSNAANLYMGSGGAFERSTSSIKYKKDVINYDKGLSEVLQMRPVYYKGISESDGDKQFAGLIAEEIHDLGLTEFVQYDDKGNPDALAYQNMVALLVKGMQEQNQLIQQLRTDIELLKNK